MQIRAATVLPARRTPVTITTADGLNLVGELALPADRAPAATLVCLHPLPTHGGMMDSHVIRKASYRLPALADLAVLRFNTRGTESAHGKSDGEFGGGETEKHDVEAAVTYAAGAMSITSTSRRRQNSRSSGCGPALTDQERYGSGSLPQRRSSTTRSVQVESV